MRYLAVFNFVLALGVVGCGETTGTGGMGGTSGTGGNGGSCLEQNYPPSIVSQPNAEYPLNRIARLNVDDPVPSAEAVFEVIVRDPNIEQTLEYRTFLDSPPDTPIGEGTIDPAGMVERPISFALPYDSLSPGVCHRFELVVVGNFASFIEPRRPVDEGDVDEATWWIEVTDAENPEITVACQ